MKKYFIRSLPTKFRNTIWIRRDIFVLVKPIKEGARVRAEISHVLTQENILYMRYIYFSVTKEMITQITLLINLPKLHDVYQLILCHVPSIMRKIG